MESMVLVVYGVTTGLDALQKDVPWPRQSR